MRTTPSLVALILSAVLLTPQSVSAECVGGAPDGRLRRIEGCDDGNSTAGDGCSPACTVEASWACTRPFDFGALETYNFPSVRSVTLPIWEFSPDGRSAWQRANSTPSVALFGADAMQAPYALQMMTNGSDDDTLGIVLGFHPGDENNPDANFIVMRWRRHDSPESPPAGLSLENYRGTPDADDFWGGPTPHCSVGNCTYNLLARGATLATQGWTRGTLHRVEVSYQPESLQISIDGTVQFDLQSGDFPDLFPQGFPEGEIGFFNNSQANSFFSNEALVRQGASVCNRTEVRDDRIERPLGSGPVVFQPLTYFSDDQNGLAPGSFEALELSDGLAVQTDPNADPQYVLLIADDTQPGTYRIRYQVCDDHPQIPACDEGVLEIIYAATPPPDATPAPAPAGELTGGGVGCQTGVLRRSAAATACLWLGVWLLALGLRRRVGARKGMGR